MAPQRQEPMRAAATFIDLTLDDDDGVEAHIDHHCEGYEYGRPSEPGMQFISNVEHQRLLSATHSRPYHQPGPAASNLPAPGASSPCQKIQRDTGLYTRTLLGRPAIHESQAQHVESHPAYSTFTPAASGLDQRDPIRRYISPYPDTGHIAPAHLFQQPVQVIGNESSASPSIDPVQRSRDTPASSARVVVGEESSRFFRPSDAILSAGRDQAPSSALSFASGVPSSAKVNAPGGAGHGRTADGNVNAWNRRRESQGNSDTRVRKSLSPTLQGRAFIGVERVQNPAGRPHRTPSQLPGAQHRAPAAAGPLSSATLVSTLASAVSIDSERPPRLSSPSSGSEGSVRVLSPTERPDIVRRLPKTRLQQTEEDFRAHLNLPTLASDVLRSFGCHPAKPGLNQHLEHLIKKFDHITEDSDLSTLRWDLINDALKTDMSPLSEVIVDRSHHSYREQDRQYQIHSDQRIETRFNQSRDIHMQSTASQSQNESSRVLPPIGRPEPTRPLGRSQPHASGGIMSSFDCNVSQLPTNTDVPPQNRNSNMQAEIHSQPHILPPKDSQPAQVPASRPISNTSYCSQCHSTKAKDQFSPNSSSGVVSSECENCQRKREEKERHSREGRIAPKNSRSSDNRSGRVATVASHIAHLTSDSSGIPPKMLKYVAGELGGRGQWINENGDTFDIPTPRGSSMSTSEPSSSISASMPPHSKVPLRSTAGDGASRMTIESYFRPGQPRSATKPSIIIPPNSPVKFPVNSQGSASRQNNVYSASSLNATPSSIPRRSLAPISPSPHNSTPMVVLGGGPWSAESKKRGRSFSTKLSMRNVPLSEQPWNKNKKGRPFTSQAAAKSAAAKAERKARREAGEEVSPIQRKSGSRPTKLKGVHQEIDAPKAVYNPFLCEWGNCPAELSNLDTVRRHVFLVHHNQKAAGSNTVSEDNICLWAKCDGKEIFETEHEWKEHIENAHMLPLAWYMGDGPNGALSDPPDAHDEIPPWLKDENGNQVTPSIRDQVIEDGRAKVNNARRFRKIRDKNGRWYMDQIKDPRDYLSLMQAVHNHRQCDDSSEDEENSGSGKEMSGTRASDDTDMSG